MGNPAFFSDPQLNNRIRHVAQSLKGINNSNADQNRPFFLLGVCLDIIASNAAEFDQQCRFNITLLSTAFTSSINNASDLTGQLDYPRLSALTFRFVSEFDLSMGEGLSSDLQLFVENVISEHEGYPPEYKNQVQYSLNRMPVAILKSIINSEEFISLRNVQGIAKSTNDKIGIWSKELSVSESRVNALQSTLKEQETAFNFVGISKGFSDLQGTIKGELEILQSRLPIFGFLVLIPITIEFLSVIFGLIDVSKSNPLNLIASAIISVTLTLLFLYFFRITLRSADACKAQLLQVRLRMTLCQFIENYAEYSSNIKSKNADALSKFENLIFAGIVNSDDKLPSTFDGMEQLSGLFKAVNGDAK